MFPCRRLDADRIAHAHRPPRSTTPMIPALRMRVPSAARSSTACISPGRKRSSCAQGLRSPVTSTMAPSPRRSRAPVGSASRSMPSVSTFSPMPPGGTSKPRAASSARSSACSRCTWRRLGCVGSRATRDRCFTVAPACASPATPRPSTRVISATVCLEKRCVPSRATATMRGVMRAARRGSPPLPDRPPCRGLPVPAGCRPPAACPVRRPIGRRD